MADGKHLKALAAELKEKVKEAGEHSEHMGPQDAEFERLARLGRKELVAELRALRKELALESITKMAKHQIINEIMRLKFMIAADEHVPYTDVEVADAKRKSSKREAKHASMSAAKLSEAVTAPKRKPSAAFERMLAHRKAGMSLKDAWAAAKKDAAKPEAPKAEAPAPSAALAAIHALREKAKKKASKAPKAPKKPSNPYRARLAALINQGMSLSEAAALLKERMGE